MRIRFFFFFTLWSK